MRLAAFPCGLYSNDIFEGLAPNYSVNLLEDERNENSELQELEGLIRTYRKASVADRKNHR